MNYDSLLAEAGTRVREIMPWDMGRALSSGSAPLLLDVREPEEFRLLHIPGSINVPRGILEQSCEWDYDETVPQLASGRQRRIIVICRSGKRSILAADVMLRMGFVDVVSLKLGVRGWNDSELPLQNSAGRMLDADEVDALLLPRVRPEQRNPNNLKLS